MPFVVLGTFKNRTMKTASFEVGNRFEHYNGYIWTITQIAGKTISLESESDGQIAKGSMTAKDLVSVIKAGYYKPVSK